MESRAPGRRVTLLIVEDDRRIRRAMRLLFATLPESVGVVAAASADAALRRAAELEPGVALVDVTLSQGVTGLHVLRTLTDAGWSVVALSAHGGHQATAMGHGATAFVDTGVDPDEIVGLVRRLLGHLQPDRRNDAIGAAD